MSTELTGYKPSDSVSVLKGIGPKKEKILKENGINTLEDIIYIFPRQYEDRRNLIPISEMKIGEEVLVS